MKQYEIPAGTPAGTVPCLPEEVIAEIISRIRSLDKEIQEIKAEKDEISKQLAEMSQI